MTDTTLKGVLNLSAGVFVFSIQDALLKYVSGSYPLTEALVFRTVVAVPILTYLVWRGDGLAALFKNVGFLALRAFILFFAYTAYYLAFPALPLTDAVALYFTVPLFVVIMAGPYLGERSNWKVWAAVLIGLAGVAVMLRPGEGLFEWAALLSLFSAATYAFSQLMARKVGATTSASVLSFYQNLVFFIVAVVLALLFRVTGIQDAVHPSLNFLVRPWTTPNLADGLIMAACGIVAAAGTVLLVNGYRYAAANIAAAFEYTGLIWLTLWGWVFFHEVPRASTVAGAGLIVIAGLLALRARRSSLGLL
jgi:drug/metabolite transporter (DMT)-like permease